MFHQVPSGRSGYHTIGLGERPLLALMLVANMQTASADDAKGLAVVAFIDQLRAARERTQSLLCVGLDVDPRLAPPHVVNRDDWITEFNRGIIEANPGPGLRV